MSTSSPRTDRSTTTLAQLIAARVADLEGRKSKTRIAREAGITAADAIAMFASGAAKVRLEDTLSLAAALEVDPPYFFELVLKQYWAKSAVEQLFPRSISQAEFSIVQTIRNITEGDVQRLAPEMEKRLRELFSSTEEAG